jgi:hypothetical protein
VEFIGAEILDKAEKDPVRLKNSLFTWSEDFFPAKQLAWSTVQQFQPDRTRLPTDMYLQLQAHRSKPCTELTQESYSCHEGGE